MPPPAAVAASSLISAPAATGPAVVDADSSHFVLMAGDAFHHMAQLRPSVHVPLPEHLRTAAMPPTTPLYVPAGPRGTSIHLDPERALQTIRQLQAFDGDDRILVIAAHDMHLMFLLQADDGLFPHTANDFVAKGWVARSRWDFLKDVDAVSSTAVSA